MWLITICYVLKYRGVLMTLFITGMLVGSFTTLVIMSLLIISKKGDKTE